MKPWLRILLAIIMTGFIAIILVYKLVYNKPHPDYEKEKAVYTLMAKDLYDQYKMDKTAADTKYTGKVIEVDGSLSKIEETDSLLIAVFVFNQGMFGDEGIRVTLLPDFVEQAKKLTPESTVKLKGYCTGYNDTDVILEKGSIVQ